jgi:hypothetical protein
MTAVRERARVIAVIWLLGQVATLAAFVPENCCVAHANERAAKAKQEACHEEEPPAPQPGDACPMQHGEGAACPMHNSKSGDCCVMKNACAGPGTHLTTLFVYVATIERPATVDTLLESADAVRLTPPALIFRTATPDAPPPKA